MKKRKDLFATVASIIWVICFGALFLFYYYTSYDRVRIYSTTEEMMLLAGLFISIIPVVYLYVRTVFKRVVHSRYVYLSFSHTDRDVALLIKKYLEIALNRYSVYRYEVLTGDEDVRYGDDMAKSVQELIHNSRAVVILASPGYISSEWCQFEFNTLDFEKQRIIPIVYDVEHNGGFGVLKQLPTDIQHIKGLHIDTNTAKTELEYNLVLVAKSIIRDLPNKKRVD